jgi:hypothetical protein
VGSDFSKQLERHHSALIQEITRVEEEIAARTQQLRQLQLKLESVLELMKLEGAAPPQAHRHFIEVAHDRLLESGPCHYADLARELRVQRVLIPGTKPEANLLAHMSRDERFVKVGRGTYAVRTGARAKEHPRVEAEMSGEKTTKSPRGARPRRA